MSMILLLALLVNNLKLLQVLHTILVIYHKNILIIKLPLLLLKRLKE